MKTKSYATLKRQLDKVFSEWTRRRFASANGFALCVTCGKAAPWRSMQCGHFIPRSYLAARWNPLNCFVQDAACNVFKRGAYPEFSAYLIRSFGAGYIDTLLALKRQPVKFTRSDLQAMIDDYSAKIKEFPCSK